MYDYWIDKYMPSQEMRQYLKTTALEPYMVMNLVFCALVPITEKAEDLKKLLRALEWNGVEKDDLDRCREYIEHTEKAIRELNDSGVFLVEVRCYDEDEDFSDGETICVAATLQDALDEVHRFFDGGEMSWKDLNWFELEKWVPDDNGKLQRGSSYYVINDEICLADTPSGRHWYYPDMSDMNLDLPVPFLPGDLVETDGWPFSPKEKMLIIDVGDNRDCCCLQALFRKPDGTWDFGAVKHAMVGSQTYPRRPLLYTMTRTDECGGGPEAEVFRKLREVFGTDQKKYEMLCEKLYGAGVIHDRKLLELAETCRDKATL